MSERPQNGAAFGVSGHPGKRNKTARIAACGYAPRTRPRSSPHALSRACPRRAKGKALRQTESRLNPRLCYFCIKGVAGIIINTEVYVPQWSDFYLTQKRDAHGNYTK